MFGLKQFQSTIFRQQIQKRWYSTGSVSSLVVLEHDSKKLNSASLSTITAAKKLGGSVNGVVFVDPSNPNSQSILDTISKISNLDKVYVYSNEQFKHFVAEMLEPQLIQLQKQKNFTHILASHSAFGKNLLPRLAATFDVSPISDILSVSSPSQFVRPIYAGNAMCQIESTDALKLITVRSTAFDKSSTTEDAKKEKLEVLTSVETPSNVPKWCSEQLTQSTRPELQGARVVVSGGRALKSGENFKILYDLADQLNGAVGATRAAVDAGYVPNDMQVGQTGKVVAPEVYIACGVSGAIQHLAGMKDSKVIVAINKDAEAPIFQIADYGLVQDLFTAVPELTKLVEKNK